MVDSGGTNVTWFQNTFRIIILRYFNVSLILTIILIVFDIYLLFLGFNEERYFWYCAILLGFVSFIIALNYALYSSYREAPTYIGFSNKGLSSKYLHKPSPNLYYNFYPLDSIAWKDIKEIKQVLGLGRMGKTELELYEDELQNPIMTGLLFRLNNENKYTLFNIDRSMMNKIIIRFAKSLEERSYKIPINEKNLKYRLNKFYSLSSEQNMFNVIGFIIVIPVIIMVFAFVYTFSIYIAIIFLFLIITITIYFRNYELKEKKKVIVQTIAYEKMSGKNIIPKKYNKKFMEFEKDYYIEIKDRLNKMESMKNKIYYVIN
jgi:hypothetical protein